jgi:hypothetical protein
MAATRRTMNNTAASCAFLFVFICSLCCKRILLPWLIAVLPCSLVLERLPALSALLSKFRIFHSGLFGILPSIVGFCTSDCLSLR